MFEVERLIAECQRARAAAGSGSVLGVVGRAVADPREVLRELGEPRRAGLHVLFRSAGQHLLAARDGKRRWQNRGRPAAPVAVTSAS